LFEIVFALHKDRKFYPLVGVAATAGAKALQKPPGVLTGMYLERFFKKNQVVK
jgi:hypothetical protein